MSTSYDNKASFLPSKAGTLEIRSTPVELPGPDQLLIRNHAIAINPIDWKVKDSGAAIKSYPIILGTDVAGDVVEVGSDVTQFKKGDRVLAATLYGTRLSNTEAAFQNYTMVAALVTSKIPDALSFEQASVVPLSVMTAADGLYGKDQLSLPYPSLNPKKSDQRILIWGGSSSIGSSAIQLAVASGVEVITTASKHNTEYCKSLGATHVFDYSSPAVIGDLVAELQKGSGKFVGALDTNGSRDSTMSTAQVLVQLGGGYIANVLTPPQDLPATVTSTQLLAKNVVAVEPAIGKAVFADFLTEALKSGQFQPLPKADVVGKGLKFIQEGLDKNKKGVSASKVVISLL